MARLMIYEACVSKRLDGALRGEGSAVVVGELFPLPLATVLREQRHGRGVDCRRASEARREATLGREMRADEIAGALGKEKRIGRERGGGLSSHVFARAAPHPSLPHSVGRRDCVWLVSHTDRTCEEEVPLPA